MDLEALMSTLGSGNYRGVANQGVVDARVGDEVRLELVQVDIQRTVEPQRRRDRTDNLGDEAIKVLVRRPRDIEIPSANVVHGLVVNQKCAVGVLNGAMGRQNGIVGLDDGIGHSRSGVHGELELRLFAIVV